MILRTLILVSVLISSTLGFAQSGMHPDSLMAGINEFIREGTLKPYAGWEPKTSTDSLLATAYFREASKRTLADWLQEVSINDSDISLGLQRIKMSFGETPSPRHNVIVTALLERYVRNPEERDLIYIFLKEISENSDIQYQDAIVPSSPYVEAAMTAGLAYTVIKASAALLKMNPKLVYNMVFKDNLVKVRQALNFGIYSKTVNKLGTAMVPVSHYEQKIFIDFAKVNPANTKKNYALMAKELQDRFKKFSKNPGKNFRNPTFIREMKQLGLAVGVGVASGAYTYELSNGAMKINPLDALDYFQAVLVLELEDRGLMLLGEIKDFYAKITPELKSNSAAAVKKYKAVGDVYVARLEGLSLEATHFMELGKNPATGQMNKTFEGRVMLQEMRNHFEKRIPNTALIVKDKDQNTTIDELKKDFDARLEVMMQSYRRTGRVFSIRTDQFKDKPSYLPADMMEDEIFTNLPLMVRSLESAHELLVKNVGFGQAN